jgi:hypothetical protein
VYLLNRLSANPQMRPSPKVFLEEARAPGNVVCMYNPPLTLKGRYFANGFVDTNLFLGEIAVKDKAAADAFYASLPSVCGCIVVLKA